MILDRTPLCLEHCMALVVMSWRALQAVGNIHLAPYSLNSANLRTFVRDFRGRNLYLGMSGNQRTLLPRRKPRRGKFLFRSFFLVLFYSPFLIIDFK